MAQIIGSIEVGKLADLVLWKPAFFGAKPEMVLKGGVIAWAQMGDPNASIPTPQPVLMRPMFGSFGRATSRSCIAFVSQASIAHHVIDRYALTKRVVPVSGVRKLTKKDMRFNDATPVITVDPETYRVTADGEHLTCAPAQTLPLTRAYHLFWYGTEFNRRCSILPLFVPRNTSPWCWRRSRLLSTAITILGHEPAPSIVKVGLLRRAMAGVAVGWRTR